MNDDHWTVLGVAPPRATWFGTVARWATTATLPIDFVKCVSPAEARARLHGGRVFSALLLGPDTPGVDRDLVDVARAAGTISVAVGGSAVQDWRELGASAVLADPFEPAELLGVLARHATPVARLRPTITSREEPAPNRWRGHLIAVTGAGGSGTSVTAMALAQDFGADPSNRGLVVLADLSLHADQGMLHDTRTVIPGLPELVEAHRSGRLPVAEVRAVTFSIPARGYDLLLGVRRHRDWTALRAHALDIALLGILGSYRVVIADVDADIEGQAETGSLDIEDRNMLARTALRRADVAVVTGDPDTKGLHRLGRTVRDLVDFGVEAQRVVVAITRAPRSRRRRAELTRAVAALLDGPRFEGLSNPAFVPRRAEVEEAIRDGAPLPGSIARALHSEVARRVTTLEPAAPTDAPTVVEPGTLGTWTEEPA